MLTLYHAGNSLQRTERLLKGRFTSSDEEQLNEWTAPAVWVSSEVYPWANQYGGRRVLVPRLLELSLDATEAEIEQYVDLERGIPSGAYWLPFEFLNERISSVREVDPAVFSSKTFWRDWQEWYDRRQAILAAHRGSWTTKPSPERGG